jgi:HAD superfamily hydrolase (TIGR01549 family)
MQKISDIAVCIWDFDGTMYRQQPGLWESIRESEIQVIRKYTGWSEEKAKEEFYKIYGVITPSGTKATALLTGLSDMQASLETSAGNNYQKYLKKDPKLALLFASLSKVSHYLLVNGTQESVHRGASLLGLDITVFTEIVTSEIIGETKPSQKGFRYIMEKTGLPAAAHLMIGDREKVDLAPAKDLGIRTCLVWQDTPGEIAEVTVPTVYDVPSVLG